MIALLNEQKQAIIHRAVTRGLDPSVPLKPSGIPWLGDIPQHWDVMPLRRLVSAGRRITYGIVQPGDPHDGGIPMVRGKDYSTGWVTQDSIFRVSSQIERAYVRSRLMPADIVTTIVGAGVGNVALVPDWLDGANITQTTARISINANASVPSFVLRVLEGPIGRRNLERYVYGAAQPRLNLPHVGAFDIPVPPQTEQLKIAAFLDKELRDFAKTSARLEREIELLREYRTRLVADVVTGKLDVREAAAGLPDGAPSDTAEDDADLKTDSDASDEDALV